MAKKRERLETLVLCIDRDDDLGRKAGVKSPIVGRDANVRAATALALADPKDSDANTIFEAVRTYDTLVKDGSRCEVVTITGHHDVGVRSDTRIAEQLDKILEETGAERVVFVTDGLQDEHIIPLVQSRADIIAVNRVVMKQSERLEGMYYMIHDFIDNPKMSKIILGVPALAFLLIAIFGTAGWRVVLGGLGLYLLVKGFKLESWVTAFYDEIATSFSKRRVSFFFYITSLFVLLIGTKNGFDFVRLVGTTTALETAAAFIQGSTFVLFIGFAIALIGKVLTVKSRRREIVKHITYGSMGLGVALVSFEAAHVILVPEGGFLRLFASLIFGLFVVAASRIIERVA